MIKEFETTKLLTSVEHNGKIVGLYFEHELPPILSLYHKYGKENVHTREIRLKSFIEVITDKDFRRRVNRRINNT